MKVKLLLKRTGVGSQVFIDDKPADGVTAVEVRAAVGEATTVVVYFQPDQVEVEADVDDVPWVENGSHPP